MPTTKAKQQTRDELIVLSSRVRRLFQQANKHRETCESCGYSHTATETPEYIAWASEAAQLATLTVRAIHEGYVTAERAAKHTGEDLELLSIRVRSYALEQQRIALEGSVASIEP